MKRLLIIIICIFLVLSAMPFCVSAADSESIKGDLLGKGKPTLGSFSILGQYLLGLKKLDETQNATSGNDTSDITVVVIPKLINTPYFNECEKGAKKCEADYGFNLVCNGPAEAEASKQVDIIEDYIAQVADAIAVDPIDPNGIAPVLKQAADAGIKVIDRDTAAQPDSVLYSVRPIDDKEYAEALWGAVFAGMGDDELYVILTGDFDDADYNTLIDYGEAYKEEYYPDKILVTDIIPTNGSAQAAYSMTIDLITAFPDIKGFICLSEPAVIGAGQAISDLGMQDYVTVIGTGISEEIVPYLKDGSVDASYIRDAESLDYIEAYIAYMFAADPPLRDNLAIDAIDSPIQINEDGKSVILDAPLIITAKDVNNLYFYLSVKKKFNWI